MPWLTLAATDEVAPTVDVLLLNEGGSPKYLMIRNEIKSEFRKGRFWIPLGSTLQFKVNNSPQKQAGGRPEESSYTWQLIASDNTVETEKTGELVRFTLNKPKEASITLEFSQSGQKFLWEFYAADPPWIQIVEPKQEKIITYGENVHFLANSSDTEGKLPNIIWLVRHKNVQHVIGSGDEIDFRWFDVGYNEIRP